MSQPEVTEHAATAAQAATHAAGGAANDIGAKAQEIQNFVWNHIADGNHWHLPVGGGIHLPSPLTVHSLMLLIASGILALLFIVLTRHRAGVPSKITNLLEIFVIFIRDDIAIPSMGEHDGRKYTPLFCSFFFFILVLNLMGLCPLFATATANLSVTAGLSLITFVVMIGGALLKNGPGGLLHAFMPGDVPKALLLLFVPLEMMGVLIKTFALTIRLFANMLAGHVVVLFLLGLMVLFGVWGLPAIFMALFILLIEILVAFLQAYVFTLLSAVFIGQIHHPSH